MTDPNLSVEQREQDAQWIEGLAAIIPRNAFTDARLSRIAAALRTSPPVQERERLLRVLDLTEHNPDARVQEAHDLLAQVLFPADPPEQKEPNR